MGLLSKLREHVEAELKEIGSKVGVELSAAIEHAFDHYQQVAACVVSCVEVVLSWMGGASNEVNEEDKPSLRSGLLHGMWFGGENVSPVLGWGASSGRPRANGVVTPMAPSSPSSAHGARGSPSSDEAKKANRGKPTRAAKKAAKKMAAKRLRLPVGAPEPKP